MQAQVADFGLSHVTSEGPIVTKDVGTVCYAAPELLTHGLLTRKADVYSYGAPAHACSVQSSQGMCRSSACLAVDWVVRLVRLLPLADSCLDLGLEQELTQLMHRCCPCS